MNEYRDLRTDAPYQPGDEVEGTAYRFSEEFGMMYVAVDEIYAAAIPKRELYGEVKPGDTVHARVARVREDGTLDLSIRQPAHLQMQDDMKKILVLLEEYGGVLPFTEKADPEVIRRETGMSKNEFKRAVGHLYKERKIRIEDGKVRSV
ncbi:MAG: hypothetical protein IKO11_02850 [Lachnospiraceae bacterium]|nr:hypothetical protein [Lachnospiraceae bacterium]